MKRVAMGVVLGQAVHGGVAAEMRENCVLPQAGADWSVHRTEDIATALRSAEGAFRSGVFVELDLAVCGADGDFPSTVPTLHASMPTHGHGTNYDAVVQQRAPGRYRVEGLNFHMPGPWRLSVATAVNGEQRSIGVVVRVAP